ncbi:MAG: hypothetical protein ABIH23_07900, partial [bacterium]
FLRGLIIDQMLHELREVQHKLETQESVLTQSLDEVLGASIEAYRVNKISLKHIETVIEALRKDPNTRHHLDDLVIAAAHIRLGLTSLHSALVGEKALSLEAFEESDDGSDSLHDPKSEDIP